VRVESAATAAGRHTRKRINVRWQHKFAAVKKVTNGMMFLLGTYYIIIVGHTTRRDNITTVFVACLAYLYDGY